MKNITSIRKKVCTIANNLLNKGTERNVAFKEAWRIVKQGLRTNVKGVTFNGRQESLRKLDNFRKNDIVIELHRDVDNPFGNSAIAVMAIVENTKLKIGYISKELSSYIAEVMDKHLGVKATLSGIRGGYYGYYGMNIVLDLKVAA